MCFCIFFSKRSSVKIFVEALEVIIRQIICWQYHGTTMVREVNCSISADVVVSWWKRNYSSKKWKKKKIIATAMILPWPRKQYDFTSVTMVVPHYNLQMIWRIEIVLLSPQQYQMFSLDHYSRRETQCWVNLSSFMGSKFENKQWHDL